MSKSDSRKELRETSVEEKEISLNTILKFIKPFTGDRDKLTAFLRNCDSAISLASSRQEDLILKYILSQLEGKAETACSIKEFDSWASLKEFLKTQFGERKHYAHLLTELQDCKQGNLEPVSQFSLRVETCLQKLLTEVTVSNSKKMELAGRLAAMEDLALHTFTLGLHPRISNLVRCRDPKNLNDAINCAISEEKIQQFSFRNNFKQKSNETIPKRNDFNNKPQSKYNYNNDNQYAPSSSKEAPFCRYCKKTGHTLENCRLRDYNNKKYSNGPKTFTPYQSTSKPNNYKPGPRINFAENDEVEVDTYAKPKTNGQGNQPQTQGLSLKPKTNGQGNQPQTQGLSLKQTNGQGNQPQTQGLQPKQTNGQGNQPQTQGLQPKQTNGQGNQPQTQGLQPKQTNGQGNQPQTQRLSFKQTHGQGTQPQTRGLPCEKISRYSQIEQIYEIITQKKYLPYVKIQTSVNQDPLIFLIDSGASICVLKQNSITNPLKLQDKIIKVKGIDAKKDTIRSQGCIEIKLNFTENLIISHTFHAFEDMELPYDGIIGNDLFNKHNCRINYQSGLLEINNHKIQLCFDDPSYTIQPRTETVIESSVRNPELKEGLILNQNISDSLLVSNCLVKVKDNNRVNLTVLNVSDQEIYLNSNLMFNLSPIEVTENNSINHVNSYNSLERSQQLSKLLPTAHLNEEELYYLKEICYQYSDIFHLPGDQLTCTDVTQHEIKTTSPTPINVKSYRFPEIHKEEVQSQINKMLEQKIITPSRSPWSSPIWIVPKKEDSSGKKKWRIVIDYRKLNDITIGESYPIPQINEILDQLGKSKYFTTLDLASGFHQIQMSPADAPKTAFSVPQGHFQFNRMPFGLKNAPASFQRTMNTVLSGLQGVHCFVYLDDVVVYSYDLPSHIEKLHLIFEKLRKFQLKLQPDKCEFLRKEVAYLGHIISNEGVKPNPEKIKAVVQFPPPKCAKDIKSFLGLASYYRRFIPEFSKYAKSLTTLLKKDVPFEWTNTQQLSFEQLKNKLVTAPVLAYPDFTKPFILTCDASSYAISAVLSQGDVGKDRPIAYASRTLNKAECNYSVTEKECLAIVYGTKTFRPYLFGRRFTIITDHKPLNWLFNCKDPGSRLVRWRLKLEEYDYEIQYKKGKMNSNADALSRYPVNPVHEQNDQNPTTDSNRPENLPETIDSPDNLDLPDDLILPEDLELPEDFNIPTPPSVDSNVNNDDDTYSKCMKTLNNRLIKFNTKIEEHNESLLKTKIKHIIIPTSIDLDESNHYVADIIGNLSESTEFLSKERTLHSFVTFQKDNTNYYLLFVKVYHYEKNSYKDIFKSLNNLKTEFIANNVTEFSITDFRNPFDVHTFTKIYNIITYLFHDTNITIHIYKNSIIYPAMTEINKILKENHDIPISGHLGSNRMLSRIQERYYWRNMRSDVENYVRKCDLCQTNKALRKINRAPMQITSTSTQPFERVALDLVGPLPEAEPSRYKFILTLQDDLTKYSAAYPLPNATAEESAECLIHFICQFGIPKSILTDQGTNFTAELFKQTCTFLKIKHLWSSPYHPQTQGALERSHSTLKEYLKSFINEYQDNWPKYVLFTAMLTYNTTVHSTTNFTPYELVFGHKPFIPSSIYDTSLEPTYNSYVRVLQQRLQLSREKALENILKSKSISKSYYDKRTKPIKYKVGDMVYVKNHLRLRKALSPIWKGPFKVVRINGNNTLTLLLNRRHVKYHYDELKLAETNSE
ncbi:unnamed protein product [Euphydryas editha]|uniref:RNA-directed DNA polymerase n=1 Tax=Euphydryas editha TaxID=104508 RepID=A0AAU9TWZ5_EUPED|nr:unnamed protein product [Euphydryas editha]